MLVQVVSLFVIGGGVGWLAGLSVSPVIATILASLVGIAGGIVAGARSLGNDSETGKSKVRIGWVDARPAAVLVLGIVIGAPLGIMARTHQIFEAPGRDPSTPAARGVLFGASAEECERLRARLRSSNVKAFRDVLAATGDWGRLLESEISDTDTLKTIVEDLCEAS
ncbi:MAG: hypothetical protein GY763_00845 [Gammaproteobacteria bacterium]|nr:hypothetical protein [Gammaproteobacteria bacterium]